MKVNISYNQGLVLAYLFIFQLGGVWLIPFWLFCIHLYSWLCCFQTHYRWGMVCSGEEDHY